MQHLYPSLEMRTCSDYWDVVIREEDLERAVETLETKAGFRAHDRAYHDVPLVDRNVLLELHFNLKEERSERPRFRRWRACRSPLHPQQGLRVPDPNL